MKLIEPKSIAYLYSDKEPLRVTKRSRNKSKKSKESDKQSLLSSEEGLTAAESNTMNLAIKTSRRRQTLRRRRTSRRPSACGRTSTAARATRMPCGARHTSHKKSPNLIVKTNTSDRTSSKVHNCTFKILEFKPQNSRPIASTKAPNIGALRGGTKHLGQVYMTTPDKYIASIQIEKNATQQFSLDDPETFVVVLKLALKEQYDYDHERQVYKVANEQKQIKTVQCCDLETTDLYNTNTDLIFTTPDKFNCRLQNFIGELKKQFSTDLKHEFDHGSILSCIVTMKEPETTIPLETYIWNQRKEFIRELIVQLLKDIDTFIDHAHIMHNDLHLQNVLIDTSTARKEQPLFTFFDFDLSVQLNLGDDTMKQMKEFHTKDFFNFHDVMATDANKVDLYARAHDKSRVLFCLKMNMPTLLDDPRIVDASKVGGVELCSYVKTCTEDANSHGKVKNWFTRLHRSQTSLHSVKTRPQRSQSRVQSSVRLSKQDKLYEEKITSLANYIHSQHIKDDLKIIFVTGAGISVSAGIPDYRSKGGFYDTLPIDKLTDLSEQEKTLLRDHPEYLMDIGLFLKNPKPYLEIKRPFLLSIAQGKWKPTLTHWFQNYMNVKHGLLKTITTNVDGLEFETNMPKETVCQYHGSSHEICCRNPNCNYKGDFTEFIQQLKTNVKNVTGKPEYNQSAPKTTNSDFIKCPECKQFTVCPSTKMYANYASSNQKAYQHNKNKCFLIKQFKNKKVALQIPPSTQNLKNVFKECNLLIYMGTNMSVGLIPTWLDVVGKDCRRVLINLEEPSSPYNLVAVKARYDVSWIDDLSLEKSRDTFIKGESDKVISDLIEKLSLLDPNWKTDFIQSIDINNLADNSSDVLDTLKMKS